MTLGQVVFPIVVAQGGGVGCMLLFIVPVAVVLLVKGAQSLSQQLLIQKTPTSQCGNVLPGLVELKATVVADEALDSPLTDDEVVYYDYEVEEQVDKSSSDRVWETVAEGTKTRTFYVRDETGRVKVDPTGAELHSNEAVNRPCRSGHPLFERGPEHRRHNSTGLRRFYEENIAVGNEIYVLGTARERPDLGIPELYAGDDDDPFLISVEDESRLVDNYFNRAFWQLSLGAILATAVPVMMVMIGDGIGFGAALETAIVPTFVVGLGMAGFIWFIYRVKHAEHLGDLEDRIERSRGMLQREVEHRERLVGQLADVVGKRSGEAVRQRIETMLDDRQIRGRSAQRSPTLRRLGIMIDRQSQLLEQIFEMAINVDDLASEESFREIVEELTRCEKQIVMARNFYNEGMSRMGREPEATTGEIAYSRGGIAQSVEFEPFEKKPIDVVLPEDPDSEYGGVFEREDDVKPPEALETPTESAVPAESADSIEDAAGTENIEERLPEKIEEEVLSRDVELDDDFGVTMEFRSEMQFGEGGGLGDIGSFGDTRSFDEVGDNWTFAEKEEREPYGFDEADRRTVDDVFSEE